MFSKKKYFSLFIFIISALILVFHNYTKSPWKELRITQNDIYYYYAYLPATFIQNDPFFEHKNEYDNLNHYWTINTPIGKQAPKMTMGVALLQIPFFFLGNFYAQVNSKYQQNGFSKPYQLAISFSSVFYTILGLFCLWFFLKRRFSDLVTAFTLIFIGFGTNLYYYSVYETGMSHPYSFFLIALSLILSESWLNKKKLWKSVLLGIAIGWITLIRPINILFLLPLVILFKERNISWKIYLKQLFQPYFHVLLIVIGAILICLPQLLFWKIQTDSFLYYSYGNEHFFWLKSHIIDGLFSFRKGWFIYTPMMFFALFGLFRLYKTKKAAFWSIAVFLPVFFYVTFSWWCWWYGGGFSARTLIDILPLMALPLAAMIEWVLQNKFRSLLMLIPCFFVYLNLFQSWQKSKGYIHHDAMTWKGYKTIFLSNITPIGYWQQLNVPDYENAKKYGEEKRVKHVK